MSDSNGGIRTPIDVTPSVPTTEGAGVRLRRAFGQANPRLDPFLLLDDFSSDEPKDYVPGFPWHPHRGIETITYMMRGEMAHRDSLGNEGVIRPGGVQWMTAGSGIIHEEMPRPTEGSLWGFQLWCNLPSSHKMCSPRYQECGPEQLPVADVGAGARGRVICGEAAGVTGPIKGVATSPTYLDVTVRPDGYMRQAVPAGHNALVYMVDGSASFGDPDAEPVPAHSLAVLGPGDRIKVFASRGAARFLLLAAPPIDEPVAWQGPIVMNTREELETAFKEYRQDRFVRSRVIG